MSYGNDKKLNKYLPVIMSSDLSQARFTMSLWERRLMYVCMSKLKPTDENFPVVSFAISELAKLLDAPSLSNKEYKAVEDAAENLVKRIVKVKCGVKYEVFNWVPYFKIDENNEITMQFNEHLKPFLLHLLEDKGYVKFLLKFSMPLSSTYAQRFYEMFRNIVYEGKYRSVQRIELTEIRQRLEMPDEKLKTFGHFKSRVLDVAEREINQKTDIFIGFKEIRSSGKGRAVVALYISVILKSDMVHEWDKFMLWQKDDLLEKLAQLVERKKGQKIDIEKLNQYTHESIARLVFEISDEKINLQKIISPQNFIEWQLKEWQTDMGMQQIGISEIP